MFMTTKNLRQEPFATNRFTLKTESKKNLLGCEKIDHDQHLRYSNPSGKEQ
jgi:hypothetical protein